MCLLAAGCGGSPRAGLAPPNFLVIVVDCLRPDHVSANGYQRRTTASLDRIAAQGVSFTRAMSQSNWTRPAMPSLLTGLYPSEHGLLAFQEDEDGNVLSPIVDDSIETVAERLEAAGYATALIGQQAQLSRSFGVAQGFEMYDNQAGWSQVLNRKFLNWLDGSRPERFFALLHYFDLHWPYCPPKGVRGRFNASAGEFDPCVDARNLMAAIRSGEHEVSPAELAAMIGAYDEELFGLDRRIGLLVDALVKRGVWDDTLVFVTADHGEEFLEHGSVGHRNWPWNELLHVPLIAKQPKSWPGPRAVLDDTLVESRSIAATMLDAAGLEPPAGAQSLLAALVGEHFEPRRYVVSETNFSIAVQTPSFKLITDRDGNSPRLYDLKNDPLETTDIAGERRREVAELRGFLADWRQGLVLAPVSTDIVEGATVDQLRAIGYLD